MSIYDLEVGQRIYYPRSGNIYEINVKGKTVKGVMRGDKAEKFRVGEIHDMEDMLDDWEIPKSRQALDFWDKIK